MTAEGAYCLAEAHIFAVVDGTVTEGDRCLCGQRTADRTTSGLVSRLFQVP